ADVRARPVGDQASPLHANLPGQRGLPRTVATEVDGAQAGHRRLPPLRAVLRRAAGSDLAVLDSDLRGIGDLREVQVTRDARANMARRRIRGFLAAKEEIVPADLLDRLAQSVRRRHGVGAAPNPVSQ